MGLHADVVVPGNKDKRQKNGDDVFAFHFTADRRHEKAENARKRQHENRKNKRKKQIEHNRKHCRFYRYKVDEHGRNCNNQLVHKSHKINTAKSYHKNLSGRDGKREKKVVVLGFIERGVSVEHTAEHTHCHSNQSHQGKIQPTEAGVRKRLAKCFCHLEKEHAEKAEKQQVQGGVADDPAF